MSSITKVCKVCGIEKDISNFYYNKNLRYFEGKCKPCSNAKHSEARRNSPERKVKAVSYTARWKKENPEKTQEQNKKHRNSVFGKIYRALQQHKRRSKNHGKFTPTEWSNLCSKYDNKCLCCGEKKKLTVDHVIPIALGGANTIDNIQPLCLSCNSRKGKKIIDYRKDYPCSPTP